MERLDKILANTGRWSRKEARELVRAGRVAVDGVTAQAADGKYDPAARFEVDGETVSGERLVYLMLHKPAGLVSATEDPRQPTVLELLPQHLRRVGLFPAGRLDKDPRACSCSPMTAPWPTACWPPGTTWTRPTSSGWTGNWMGRTRRPLPQG